MSVVIDGGRFTVVGPSILAQGLAGRRIDGRGKFLIPGLMDIHIHLAGFSRAGQAWIPSTKPDDSASGLSIAKWASRRWPAFSMPASPRYLDVGNIPENILPLRPTNAPGKCSRRTSSQPATS
jgi:hypothetical protein